MCCYTTVVVKDIYTYIHTVLGRHCMYNVMVECYNIVMYYYPIAHISGQRSKSAHSSLVVDGKDGDDDDDDVDDDDANADADDDNKIKITRSSTATSPTLLSDDEENNNVSKKFCSFIYTHAK